MNLITNNKIMGSSIWGRLLKKDTDNFYRLVLRRVKINKQTSYEIKRNKRSNIEMHVGKQN